MRQIRTSSTAVSQIRRHGRDEYYGSTPDVLTKDGGGTDADERSRREVINLQHEDQSMPIPYPEARIALQGLSSGTMVTPEELVPLGYPQKRTYKAAREPHCRLARPVAGDKFRTHQGQAGTSRQKKIWRLVTHWSERDLAHLPAMQRAAQEREMGNVYETFDEKELDTALAIMEHEAPAKVESSGEETLSDPAKREQIVLQIRRG